MRRRIQSLTLMLGALSAIFFVGHPVAAAPGSTPSCAVHFEGTDPDAWEDAVANLDVAVRAEPGDCATIAVRAAAAGGADVELRTRDGRAATRRIGRPDELVPVVRALLVAAPAVAPPSPSVEEETAEPEPSPAPQPASLAESARDPSASVDESHPRPPSPRASWLVGGGAGLKVPYGEDAAPVVQAFAGVALPSWEIGAFGRWEIEHDERESHDTGHTALGAIGGGALAARRQPIGPTVLVFGATLGAYAAEMEQHRHRGGAGAGASANSQGDRLHDAFVDPRAGLVVAAIIPTPSRVRTRAQLGGEVSVLRHDTPSALPEVPRWGLSLTIGVELGGD